MDRRERQESYDDLHHACAWRPFPGLKLLLDRFPNARAFATAAAVAGMQYQMSPEFISSFWQPRFPGQVPSQLVAPEILHGDAWYLEGEALKIIELGHTDTAHSTKCSAEFRPQPDIAIRGLAHAIEVIVPFTNLVDPRIPVRVLFKRHVKN